MDGWGPTSVNNVSVVQVIDSIKHLADGLRSVFLSELAIIANPVKQLAASC